MGTSRVALRCQVAHGVDDTEIFPPIGLNHDRCLDRRRILALPGVELLPVPFEGDLDQVHREKIATR